MFILPQTLSIVTTHQCTAACDHCCFLCTPKVTTALPTQRIFRLIDECAEFSSMRVVVFTGGECFLLGKNLDDLITYATERGYVTRCVTNGYWATSDSVATRRADRLVASGLKEINFSTGHFHAKYVPVERVIAGAIACADRGLTTLVNAETCNESTFDVMQITEHKQLGPLIAKNRVILQRNVWIPHARASNPSEISHKPQSSRFNADRINGCRTVLNVLSVTPTQSLVACCGLHLESIPELHLGSVEHKTLRECVDQQPDDFLKIWIHIDGPERILQFVREHVPDYTFPHQSVHPCTTCLHLYKDPVALEVIASHYKEIEYDVLDRWLSEIATEQLNACIKGSKLPYVYNGSSSNRKAPESIIVPAEIGQP